MRFLIHFGRGWVASQRSLYHPRAGPLTERQTSTFAGFYSPETLNATRAVYVSCIENPDFYYALTGKGVALPIDLRQMSGITFVDTIVLSESRKPPAPRVLPLLFHELVHVVQYQKMGLHRFIERYVRGWLENGLDYVRIPIEAHAYDLQTMYEADPTSPFSVESEVSARSGSY